MQKDVVVRDSEGKFHNTHLFKEAGQFFQENGVYTFHPHKSIAWKNFWDEELRRTREGFTSGDITITGDHYFYLNYVRIKLSRDKHDPITGKTRKEKWEDFPGFWDGDYEYFHKFNEAQATGQHVIVGKARRKGFSYKNAAIATNIYNNKKNSKVLLCAYDKKYLYPDGIMGMVTSQMNFLNEHTAWKKRRQKIDRQEHKRASYLVKVDGVELEKGYMSEVQAITFKDNPDAARGKDADIVIMEECGNFDNLKATYGSTLPCVQDGDNTTGTIVMFGTGASFEKSAMDFESMFYNPETYNILPFDNVWDEGGQGTSCGFFFPDYQNKIGFMDKEGNSQIEAARHAETKKREYIKSVSKDPYAIDKVITEAPFTPKEAFMKAKGNVFPTAALSEWRNELLRTGLFKDIEVNGTLFLSSKGVEFQVDPNVRPVSKFPHEKGMDLTGCVTIYDSPFKDGEGNTPDNMYKIFHDPYAQDGGLGLSLGAAYVYKRVNKYHSPDDMLVAVYVGRPGTQDAYNENLFMLAEYYNAKICFENDRGEVIPYAKRFHKLHMLEEEVDIYDKSEGVAIRKLNRAYGMSVGTKERKGQGELYLSQWLRTKRATRDDGRVVYNFHKIYDLALLEELIKYDRDGNFDRVSALIVGHLMLKGIYNQEIEAAEEVDEDGTSFWNRDLF